MNKLTMGQVVLFVSEKGEKIHALVTFVFHGMSGKSDGCNLVFVTTDPARQDSFGAQIERKTSVPHRTGTPAPGYFWQYLLETPGGENQVA